MYDRYHQRDIINPHLITPKALQVLRGKKADKLSPHDIESIHQYWERMEIVDKIVNNVFNHFNLK